MKESCIEIDNSFVLPPEFSPEILDTLPIHQHHYGLPMEETPTSLYWTEYQPYQPGDGKISFARKMYLQYPTVAEHVADYIRQFFPGLEIHKERVNLMKTQGSIRRHKDEGRPTSINIGIKNTTNALTMTSSTRDHSEYFNIVKKVQCYDGHAYLLDTSCLHQVVAITPGPRYLFTYGFEFDFQKVVAHYKRKD